MIIIMKFTQKKRMNLNEKIRQRMSVYDLLREVAEDIQTKHKRYAINF